MFSNEDKNRFLDQLKRHEGERLEAYLDTEGILTVGVGHNCVTMPVQGVNRVGDAIDSDLSDALFREDVEEHIQGILNKLPWIVSLDAPRQAVLYNMAFNLGVTGLLGFRNTLSFIARDDWQLAAKGMLQSRWARQTGNRARELARQMETGEWQDGYVG